MSKKPVQYLSVKHIQHPTKSPKSSQLLVRQMVLDGHLKEDCIFQSTVPGSADGADKSRSHLWPPQAELLDGLTVPLGLLTVDY